MSSTKGKNTPKKATSPTPRSTLSRNAKKNGAAAHTPGKNNNLLDPQIDITVLNVNKRKIRKAEERKNPDLKKNRTIFELDKIYRENAALVLCDQEFPDDHPFIAGIIRGFIPQIPGAPIPHVITMQERVDLCLRISYRLFAPDRMMKAKQDLAKRRKLYQEQHKGQSSFTEIYGPTPFVTEKNELTSGQVDSESAKNDRMSAVSYTKEDNLAAQRYAAAAFFGSPLMAEGLASNSPQISGLLLWWFLAEEEPYDPRAPLDGFRESCVEQIRDEVDLLEGSLEQYEKVLRGTYGTLCDHKDYQTITVITGVWNEFVERSRKSPGNENKPAVEVIKDGLIAVLSDVPRAFEMTKKMKEERERAEQENKVKTKKLEQKSPWKAVFVAAASVAVSVGLIAGAFLFFQKKWRK